MMIYGYARVSTEGQTLDARASLAAANAAKVFNEKISGAVAPLSIRLPAEERHGMTDAG